MNEELIDDEELSLKEQADPDCKWCHGKGIITVANGPEDSEEVICECIMSKD